MSVETMSEARAMADGAIMAENMGDDGIKLTPLEAKRRRQRNWAIGLALAGFVALFYVITIVKLASGGHH